MENFFENLDDVIETLLSKFYKKAVDKSYVVDKYFNEENFSFILNYNGSQWLKNREYIYKLYQLGNFDEAFMEFQSALLRIYEEYLQEQNRDTIPKKTSKKKNNDLGVQVFSPPPSICIIRISDLPKDIYKEAKKSITQYIFIREAQRKLKFIFNYKNEFDLINKIKKFHKKGVNPFRQKNKNKDDFPKVGLESKSSETENDNPSQSGSDKSINPNNDTIEVNFIKGLTLNEVVEHFDNLRKTPCKLNKKPFLTKEQFDVFISAAFLGKKLKEKITINMRPHGDKILIIDLFHNFYSKVVGYYKVPKIDEFVKLLTDNFHGFEFDNTKDNFSKKSRKENPLLKK